jgi:DNA-binding transcriptional regulator YiaG
MNKKYPSEAMQVIHEDIKGMYKLGIVSEARMKEFDKMCLAQEPEKAKQKKKQKVGSQEGA